MAIAIATTTVTIKGTRPQENFDRDAAGYDDVEDPAYIIATDVRASITLPTGLRNNNDSDEVISYAFKCDPVDEDVTRFDIIVDESTGTEYKVYSCQRSSYTGLGLEHITGRVYVTKGLQTGGGYVVTA